MAAVSVSTPYPHHVVDRYRKRGYWAGVTLGDAFEASVAEHAERVAVVDGARRVTYRELGTLVDRIARHLATRGISHGEPHQVSRLARGE